MSGIIVAFPKAQDGTAIKNLLVRNGYDVVSSCTTGAQAINLADNLGEGIIISGYRLPDMLYTGILENVEGRFEMLLVASKQRLLEDETGIAMLEVLIISFCVIKTCNSTHIFFLTFWSHSILV